MSSVAPAAISVVPLPAIVPPDQFTVPAKVTLPVPPSVPLLRLKLPASTEVMEVDSNASEPPVMARVYPTAVVRLSIDSTSPDWIVTVVGVPLLIVTSSAAVGTASLLQLAAWFQRP